MNLSMGIIIFILFYKTVNCLIVVVPTETEVMVNQSTYLNCSTTITTQEVAWYRYRVGDPYRRHDVYDAGIIDKNYRDRFYIDGDKTKGVYNLFISRVLEEDAGKYECQDNGGIGDKRSAELVVLDKNFTACQLMNSPAEEIIGQNDCGFEPTTLEFSCGVKFHGNIPPQLEWIMKRGEEEKKFPRNSSTFNSTVNEATCNLTVKAQLQMNGSSIVCKTKASTPHPCVVDDVKVLYAFNNREGVEKTLNDQVTCVANSSQHCTYKWKWFEWENHVTVANDSELTATREGWHRCEAECQFGQKTCRLVAMVIHVFPPSKKGNGETGDGQGSSTAVAVLSTVVAFLVLFISLLIIGFFTYPRWRKSLHRFTGDSKWKTEQTESATLRYVSDPVQVQELELPETYETKEF